MIHPLEWAFTRNETLYPDADAFRPERWLEKSYPTYREPLSRYPTTVGFTSFGFGRRTCLGQELAEVEVFTVVAAVAWAFDIRKKRDRHGTEMAVPWYNYNNLAIVKPENFPFTLALRSEERREKIVGRSEY